MPDALTCGECGRDRAAPSDQERAVGLCLACICWPMWFRTHHFGTPHDGRETVERERPELAGFTLVAEAPRR